MSKDSELKAQIFSQREKHSEEISELQVQIQVLTNRLNEMKSENTNLKNEVKSLKEKAKKDEDFHSEQIEMNKQMYEAEINKVII